VLNKISDINIKNITTAFTHKLRNTPNAYSVFSAAQRGGLTPCQGNQYVMQKDTKITKRIHIKHC